MVLPPFYVDVFRGGTVTCQGAVCMDGSGFLQVLLVSFPQGPGCLPYVFLITREFPILVQVDGPTLPSLAYGSTCI